MPTTSAPASKKSLTIDDFKEGMKVKWTQYNKEYTGKIGKLIENKKIKFVRLDHQGPDHKITHKVGLLVDGEKIMTCWSKTVKEAERILSKRAYKRLYENNSYS